MRIPEYVNIDNGGPFPELCESLARGAGLATRALKHSWENGVILVRGLNEQNAGLFAQRTTGPGPVVVVVHAQDLRLPAVAEAAGMSDSYTLTSDPPEVFRATLISANRRWDTERRLEESERRFRFIAESAGDVIWIWNLRAGRYEFMSPSITRLRGLSVEEALIEPLEKSLSPASLNKAMTTMEAAMAEFRANGTVAPMTELYEQPHADGSARSVEITINPLLGSDGQPEKVLGVSRDCTERVVHQRELEAALDERDTLLRELGHRIKNTLSLTGSLLSLAQGRAADARDAALFEESRSRVQAMAVLYDRLLHSRSQSRIDLGRYLGDLCRSLTDAYGSGQGVALSVNADGIETDSRKAVSLGLAVNEAVTNCIKYARVPGRALCIRVEAYAQPDALAFGVSVADDGAGLPEGYDWRHSQGLGFLLIRSLAEQLGATLSVATGPGAGTSIRIEGIR